METGRLADLSSSGRSQPAALSAAGKFRWTWLLWLAVPLVIAMLLRNAPWGDIWQALRGLKAWQFIVLAGLNMAVLAMFAARWWLILRSFGQKAPFFKLLGYRLAGFGVSYFTPGPQFGGEPLQVFLLSRKQGVITSTAVASVFFEKLLEVLGNFTFLVIGLVVVGLSGLLAGRIPLAVWPGVGLVMAWPMLHLSALARGHRPLTGLLERAGRRWQTTFLADGYDPRS